MQTFTFLVLFSIAIGSINGEYCSSNSDCESNFYITYCCDSTNQCCSYSSYLNDGTCYSASQCSTNCCINGRCCTSIEAAQVGRIATGVVVGICIAVFLAIVGCCVCIVLCFRRQRSQGRVVRAPVAATTVHTTQVMQPQGYQPGVTSPPPAAMPPPPYYSQVAHEQPKAYPPMPQPAYNPAAMQQSAYNPNAMPQLPYNPTMNPSDPPYPVSPQSNTHASAPPV